MAWDKNQPAGSQTANLIDNLIIANNAAIEDGINAEHYFATGGTQTGRHRFGFGNTTQRDAITWPTDGSIWFNSSLISGQYVVQLRVASAWVNIDVFRSNIARLDSGNVPYTACQFESWQSVTPSAGSPNTLAVDLATSPRKFATITAATKLLNPVNALAGSGTSIEFDILISGTGVSAFTFDTQYKFVNGASAGPVTVWLTNGSRNKLIIRSMQSGNYTVESIWAIGP